MKTIQSKPIQMLAASFILLALASCSKQQPAEPLIQTPATEMPATEMPAMDKATEAVPAAQTSAETAKPAEILPNEIDPADMSGANVEQDGSGKKVIFWEDPMVPGRHFSKSGQSPFMDMKLAPRYSE